MKKGTDFRQLVHTPAELSSYWSQWAKDNQQGGIKWGVPSIDDHVIPMRRGDLVGLIARPGHGKSSLMAFLAMQEAKRIIERDAVGKEVVVYVTWESSAEEIENFWSSEGQFSASDIAWGRVPVDEVIKRAIKRVRLPIWTIGHAIAKAGQKMPRMTLPAVLGALESMQVDFGVHPTLMLFDYIQLIPIVGASGRTEQVTEAPAKVKELVLRVGATAVCGIQASRDVDNRLWKIPEMQDCQWGSSIEQAFDKLFGLWMPYRTEGPDGKPITMLDGTVAQIRPELLIMRLLKQRGDKGRHTWPMYFDPSYLRLAELELHNEPAF